MDKRKSTNSASQNKQNIDRQSLEYFKERERFIKDLRLFHQQRGTPIVRLPCINGKCVDLYYLYTLVTSKGGWERIASEEVWDSIGEKIGILPPCANLEKALKQIYIRHLHHYERLHHFGRDPDHRDIDSLDADEGPRRRVNVQTSRDSIAGIPMVYNMQQHMLSDASKTMLGMTVKDFPTTGINYKHLERSLASGIPNDVDFAVNMCLLVSHQGGHVLKGPKGLRIIELLLSHVGLCKEGPAAHVWIFKDHTRLNFLKFWNETVNKSNIKDLVCPESLLTEKGSAFAIESLNHNQAQLADESYDPYIYFAPTRSSGTEDREGQRVCQIANILRNLSCEEENMELMASSLVLLRFLILCIHNNFSDLHQIALETFSNIAIKTLLEPVDCRLTQIIVDMVTRSVCSLDVFESVTGMEALSRLAQMDPNEDALCDDSIGADVYMTIIAYLCAHNVQLVLGALEVLYQLSEIGHVPSQHIAEVPKSIEYLLDLLTVDMDKMEKGNMDINFDCQIEEVEPIVQTSKSGVVIVTTSNNKQDAQTPTSAPRILRSNLSNRNVATSSSAVKNVSIGSFVSKGIPKDSWEIPTVNVRIQNAVKLNEQNLSKHAITVPTESKSLASHWLTSQYEASNGSIDSPMSRAEIYRRYLDACSAHGLQGVVNVQQFEDCIRGSFPSIICSKNLTNQDVNISGISKRVFVAPLPIYNSEAAQCTSRPSTVFSPRIQICESRQINHNPDCNMDMTNHKELTQINKCKSFDQKHEMITNQKEVVQQHRSKLEELLSKGKDDNLHNQLSLIIKNKLGFQDTITNDRFISDTAVKTEIICPFVNGHAEEYGLTGIKMEVNDDLRIESPKNSVNNILQDFIDNRSSSIEPKIDNLLEETHLTETNKFIVKTENIESNLNNLGQIQFVDNSFTNTINKNLSTCINTIDTNTPLESIIYSSDFNSAIKTEEIDKSECMDIFISDVQSVVIKQEILEAQTDNKHAIQKIEINNDISIDNEDARILSDIIAEDVLDSECNSTKQLEAENMLINVNRDENIEFKYFAEANEEELINQNKENEDLEVDKLSGAKMLMSETINDKQYLHNMNVNHKTHEFDSKNMILNDCNIVDEKIISDADTDEKSVADSIISNGVCSPMTPSSVETIQLSDELSRDSLLDCRIDKATIDSMIRKQFTNKICQNNGLSFPCGGETEQISITKSESVGIENSDEIVVKVEKDTDNILFNSGSTTTDNPNCVLNQTITLPKNDGSNLYRALTEEYSTETNHSANIVTNDNVLTSKNNILDTNRTTTVNDCITNCIQKNVSVVTKEPIQPQILQPIFINTSQGLMVFTQITTNSELTKTGNSQTVSQDVLMRLRQQQLNHLSLVRNQQPGFMMGNSGLTNVLTSSVRASRQVGFGSVPDPKTPPCMIFASPNGLNRAFLIRQPNQVMLKPETLVRPEILSPKGRRKRPEISAASTRPMKKRKLGESTIYQCNWRECRCVFETYQSLYRHVISMHCPKSSNTISTELNYSTNIPKIWSTNTNINHPSVEQNYLSNSSMQQNILTNTTCVSPIIKNNNFTANSKSFDGTLKVNNVNDASENISESKIPNEMDNDSTSLHNDYCNKITDTHILNRDVFSNCNNSSFIANNTLTVPSMSSSINTYNSVIVSFNNNSGKSNNALTISPSCNGLISNSISMNESNKSSARTAYNYENVGNTNKLIVTSNCGNISKRMEIPNNESICISNQENYRVNKTVICEWEGCDGLPRHKFSFYTHILDRHLNEASLLNSSLQKSDSQIPPSHPPVNIYPPNAALQAIRRFSAVMPFPELLRSDSISPLSRHVHLTSALILRNIARYSALGRSQIKRHENRLCQLALSLSESSSALSNCLWELHDATGP